MIEALEFVATASPPADVFKTDGENRGENGEKEKSPLLARYPCILIRPYRRLLDGS